MRRILRLLLCVGLWAVLLHVGNIGVFAEELRVPPFAKDNILRIVNGHPQDLFPIIVSDSMVVYIGGLDETAKADAVKVMETKFGLVKIDTVYEKPDFVHFRFKKKPNIDSLFVRWNEILSRAPFVSPVFEFPEGKFGLSGVIKIQWKKGYPEAEVKRVIQSFNLEIVDYNSDTNTVVIRPTDKSGKNVFLWAVLFDPLNDFRVLESRVEFVRINSPIRVEVKVEAGCLSGADSGTPVAYGIFCYRLKFFRSPDVKISFDDLSVNTKLLRTWLPAGLPSILRRFEGDRSYKTDTEKLASGEVVDVVEYKLRFLRSGEFILPPLRFYYNVNGKADENRNRLEGLAPEVKIFVSSLSPKNKITVNNIPAISNLSSPEKIVTPVWLAPYRLGIAAVVFGLIFVMVVFIPFGKPDKAGQITKEEKAYVLWKNNCRELDSLNQSGRLNLLKRMLGVYYFDQEYGVLTSANSFDWKECLGKVLSASLVEKTLIFVKEVESGSVAQTDFKALVEEVFGWEA